MRASIITTTKPSFGNKAKQKKALQSMMEMKEPKSKQKGEKEKGEKD